MSQKDGSGELERSIKPDEAKITDYGTKQADNPAFRMSDRQIEYEELPDELPINSPVPSKKQLYIAVGATYLAPIGIGLCLGYSSGAIESMKKDPNIHLTTSSISWFGSLLTVGAAVGSLLAGNLIDSMGRKFQILFGNVMFVAGWLAIIADRSSITWACVGRVLGGFGMGIHAIAVPMYIGEVATPDVRGQLGAAFQLFVTVGLTIAYLAGRWLTWHEAAVFSMGFNALCTLCVWLLTPLSPRWLLIQCERAEARRSLAKLRSLEPNSVEVNAEIEEIEDSLQQASAMGTASPREIISTRSLRVPFLIILVVHIGQQANGINCILFYAASIFEQAGMSDSNLASILIGVAQMIGTCISTLLMDRLGRRPLLFISAAMMIICLTTFGTYQNYVRYNRDPEWMEYMGLASIIGFSFSFAIGEGPVPWLVIGEMFDARSKGFCSSVCATANWGASFILAYFVADMNRAMGQDWTYWFFALCTLVIAIFEFFTVPETKGKSLEEIQAKFQ